MSNIISPDQANQTILALFATLPSSHQARLLDELKAIIDGDKGWDMEESKGIEVETIDEDDFYSHRHDHDDPG